MRYLEILSGAQCSPELKGLIMYFPGFTGIYRVNPLWWLQTMLMHPQILAVRP